MPPTKLLIAAALLCSSREPAEAMPEVTSEVVRLATAWEILDPREVRYFLADPACWLSDVRTLRDRRRLLADAPPLADARRLPDRNWSGGALGFNRAFRRTVEARLNVDLHRWEEHLECLREVDDAYVTWDLIRDATCDYYYASVRRHALKRLRERLGPEAYYAGRWPECVPLHRFMPLD